MRIAIIHSFYTAATPSGENITVEMQAQALTEAGHEVKVIESRTDETSKAPLYKVRTAVNVATGRGASPLEALQAFQPDIVHVHNLFPNFSTHWLTDWDGPLVATLHNFRPLCSNGLMFRDGHKCTLCPENGHHNAVKHACYRDSRIATLPIAIRNRKGLPYDSVVQRADKLILLSTRSHETYEKYGASLDAMTIIPNFIEPPELGASQTKTDSWLYAGRLNPEKGIVDLLHKWPNTERITVAGAGSDEETVRKIANDRPNVTFVGSLERKQLLQRLPQAQGVVIPSLCAENLPTIYLEALATGLPVIAREGNSAADDVAEWAPGMTYVSQDDLTESLYLASQNSETLAKRSTKRFDEHFTKKAWVQKMETLYKKCIHCGPRT